MLFYSIIQNKTTHLLNKKQKKTIRKGKKIIKKNNLQPQFMNSFLSFLKQCSSPSNIMILHSILVDVMCYFQYDKGEAYNGTVNTAINGEACINWKTFHSNYTHYYEDHNYCRNPRTDSFTQPWCHISTDYRSGICDIPAFFYPEVSTRPKQIY